LEVLLTQIIPDIIPWIETAERKHDSVGYYNSTATTVAHVRLNEYVQSMGKGVIVVSDTNTEGGEGKSAVDTQHGLTKGSLRRARSEENDGITTARESVAYLRENNKNPNNFYYSITATINEGEKKLRRRVQSMTSQTFSKIVNSDCNPPIEQENTDVDTRNGHSDVNIYDSEEDPMLSSEVDDNNGRGNNTTG